MGPLRRITGKCSSRHFIYDYCTAFIFFSSRYWPVVEADSINNSVAVAPMPTDHSNNGIFGNLQVTINT